MKGLTSSANYKAIEIKGCNEPNLISEYNCQGGKLVDGKIGDWNVDKSIEFLKKLVDECPANGICATRVLQCLAQKIDSNESPKAKCQKLSNFPSDHPLRVNGGRLHISHDQASRLWHDGILNSRGFVKITEGIGSNKLGSYTDKFKLQKGDICIIGNKNLSPKYHACIWCGDKWRSDFTQNSMIPYESSYPFAIFRYDGSGWNKTS